MHHKKYHRAMTALPEGASLRARYNFVLIGPQASQVATTLAQAELQTEVSELLELHETKSGSTVGQAITSTSTQELTLAADEKGTHCILDDDETSIGRIRFVTVATFSDSVPPLNDDNCVRNTCYVFLGDGRQDIPGEVLPMLERTMAEVAFGLKNVQKRLNARRPPVPVAVLLEHRGGQAGRRPSVNSTRDSLREVPSTNPALAPFSQKLIELVKGGPLRNHVVTVDFEDSSALHGAVQSIAREMYAATKMLGQSSRQLPGAHHLDEVPEAEVPQNPKNSCCAVQ